MFSKTITNSSRFLMMPASAQNLYFHLGMNSDDDGFCEHFGIVRMTGNNPDDLKILQAKKFIHIFDEQVLVVLDWKENNNIRSDRYTKSKYLDIYKENLSKLGVGIPLVDKRYTQYRLDKVSIDNNICAFEMFWKEYPKKENKKKAQHIWNTKKLDTSYEQIIEFIKKAKNTERWDKGFAPIPTTFLNNERWKDDIASYGEIKRKPYYNGDPLVEKNGKQYVISDGQWLEFAGDKKDLVYK